MPRTPVVTPLDIQASHRDQRDLEGSNEYGFVYFDDDHRNYEGQSVRVGYIGGEFDPSKVDDTTLHDVERYCPYVFNGSWGVPTFSQIIAAWDFLVEAGAQGFAEYASRQPNTVRWMNGSEFVLADRATLETAAIHERQTAVRHRRQTTTSRNARVARVVRG
jgi:hypothetical protein